MSSGELPLSAYHRAESLGAGSFGSVITVYDDDGEQYALKVFEEDDDDDDYGLNLGTLREVSILRILRGENAHPNIVAIHDIQTSFGADDAGAGAGTDDGELAMAMPLFAEGSLADCFSKITTKKQKAVIAHGLLSAVAYLHENSIIHRDIKSDNVLLKVSDTDDDIFEPVLIDFSLAKAVHPQLMMAGGDAGTDVTSLNSLEFETTHTPTVGTPTYRAVEVVNEEPYGLPSDLWSVGVVLLELLRGKCLETSKDKGAIAMIEEELEALPQGQPFPALIRGLLERDPAKRLTARQALECDLFEKFGLPSPVNDSKTFRRIFLPSAVPLDGEESIVEELAKPGGKENNKNQGSKALKTPNNKKKTMVDPVLSKRFKTIQKVCDWMEWENPMTAQAALTYSIQMAELCDDVDDLDESLVLLDCTVVAHKFFEQHLCGKSDIDDMYQHFASGREFDVDAYGENESTLLLMMDMCLYPRTIRNDIM
jgi:serine/threonine protein kinase